MKKMVSGFGDYLTFSGETLFMRIMDSTEETTGTNNPFDYLKAGIAAGKLEEVSFICSNNSSNGSDSYANNEECIYGKGSNIIDDPMGHLGLLMLMMLLQIVAPRLKVTIAIRAVIFLAMVRMTLKVCRQAKCYKQGKKPMYDEMEKCSQFCS